MLCIALTLLACPSEPRAMRVEIAVDGMVCESCVEGITHEVGRLEGVRSVQVDLDAGKAVVVYAEGVIDPAALEQTIEAMGYGATPGTPAEAP
jgi:copper chaperone CopZ